MSVRLAPAASAAHGGQHCVTLCQTISLGLRSSVGHRCVPFVGVFAEPPKHPPNIILLGHGFDPVPEPCRQVSRVELVR